MTPRSPKRHPAAKVATPGRRQRHRAEIRARLIRAALKLFATRGLEATTIQDITEAADVAKGTFFNYFSSKEEVLVGLYDFRRAILDEAVVAAREARQPIRQILDAAVRGPVKESNWTPALFRSLVLGMIVSQPARDAWIRQTCLTRQRFTDLLAIGQERGEIRTDLPAGELARIVHELSFGTLLFWSLVPSREPMQRFMDANLALLWTDSTPPSRDSIEKKR